MTKTDIEALMRPRKKCVADYPFNKHFKVGSILEFFKAKDHDGEYWYHHTIEQHQNFQDTWFNQYPHLFVDLKWYEEREASEMPEYLMPTEQGIMRGCNIPVKVIEYFSTDKQMFSCEEYPGAPMDTEDFIPCKKHDYLQYINNQNKK